MEPTPFFAFETDFTDSLQCIPMIVRYKLDRCGVKLKLQHWNQLSRDDRQTLVHQPCTTPGEVAAYRQTVRQQVLQHQPEPPADLPIPDPLPWEVVAQVPPQVLDQAAQVGQEVTLAQWQALSPLQRFVLIKLSQPGHENRNFCPALQEFGLG